MKLLFLTLLFFSPISFSGSWSTAAVPTGIDIERSHGFMIYGSFGNKGGCTKTDMVFVQKSHPQYSEIYSAVLAAYMSGKKVMPYVNECLTNSWYVTSDQTFNTLTSGGTLKVLN